jgi:trehalose 6-phosphate synthase
LAAALSETLHEHGGVWLGWSGKCDANPGDVELTRSGPIIFASVHLSPDDYRQYYVGYANSVLWPLFHLRSGNMDLKPGQFAAYARVNRLFAAAIAQLVRPDDVIWVHDYHLMLLPGELRRLGIRNRLGFFLHIPFPPPEVFTALPEHGEIVRSLLACDLIGLQTERDVSAFCRYVVQQAGGTADTRGAVRACGFRSRVGAFPIGSETGYFAKRAPSAAITPTALAFRSSLGANALMLGVDRLDYTKGIPQRIEAYRKLLERRPELRGELTYLQIAPGSREDVPRYQALQKEVKLAAGCINAEFGDIDWVPMRLVTKSYRRDALAGLYRLARVGLVTPLCDGMNLVAKEYVASQDPADPGVLVLSSFAGAAVELDAAVLTNPYDTDQMAECISQALSMGLEERKQRWHRMMQRLRINTTGQWRGRFLAALTRDEAALPTGDRVRPLVGTNGTPYAVTQIGEATPPAA